MPNNIAFGLHDNNASAVILASPAYNTPPTAVTSAVPVISASLVLIRIASASTAALAVIVPSPS